jgi:hypothetical protein
MGKEIVKTVDDSIAAIQIDIRDLVRTINESKKTPLILDPTVAFIDERDEQIYTFITVPIQGL